jgi:poly-gamma-glutamate capsule biosynthesis protein CapA/YwtB (metallophosphatase superfamily)
MRQRLALALFVLAPFVVPAPASSAPSPRSFTIAAAGDVLIHGRVAQVAHTGGGVYDFSHMFSEISPWIEDADLAICHLEVTLSPTNTGLQFYPRFVAPHEIADAIASAGYDTCSTASNHSLDRGWPGVVDTLDMLDAAGIRHDGTARDTTERLPGLYDVNGASVAHLSYTYGTNGIPLPAEHPYAVNVIDVDAILADARWARDAGADFVIVSLQWGVEYFVGPTGTQAAQAEALLGSPDIDLILGSHAHIVQPIGQIDGKYVVYGMGNQLSNQNSASGPKYYATEDGLLVLVRVTEPSPGDFEVERIDIVPTWVRRSDYVIFPARVGHEDARTATLMRASLLRTVDRVRRLDAPGIRLAPDAAPGSPCHCRFGPWDGFARRDRIPLVE